MRYFKTLLILLVLAACVIGGVQTYVAQSTEEQLSQKAKEIEELEKKVKDLQNQSKSLSLQISVMNNQIKLSELKVAATEQLLEKLDHDIILLTGKVDQLEGRIYDVSEVLLNRIVVSYKVGDIEPVQAVFASNGFADFVSRAKYIHVAQEHDRRLLFELQQSKVNYDNQKETLKAKQEEQEKLKVQLEKLNADLASQKKEKEQFLIVTQNDEKKYKQLLDAALAEKNAIESAVSIRLTDGKAVKAGEAIAIIGNSGAPGCSTGAHLHFEVRKDKEIRNPAEYLKSRDVEWNNSPDGQFSFNGSLDWPIESPRITQGYGMTSWAKSGFYGGGPHTGIDMVSASSSIIKAPKDGTAYKGSTTCRGSTMNYVAIDHGEGLFTWYWHVK